MHMSNHLHKYMCVQLHTIKACTHAHRNMYVSLLHVSVYVLFSFSFPPSFFPFRTHHHSTTSVYAKHHLHRFKIKGEQQWGEQKATTAVSAAHYIHQQQQYQQCTTYSSCKNSSSNMLLVHLS